jgi:carboxymethylenebutenolidase
MKKNCLSMIALLFGLTGFAQDGITVCQTSAMEKFALLASNKEFNMAHSSPRNYIHHSQAGGEMIKFKCADGSDANAFLIKAKKETNNWIFVFQEWWGLNDNIKRQSENFYNALGNVNVIALDMYDGKLATTPDDARKYMGEFKQDRGNAIVQGALAYVGKKAKIGTVGWCFGGGQSMQAALAAGSQAAACVIYYGAPEENIDRLKSLSSDVLMIWPTQDKWINKEMMDKFAKNMATAGKKLTIKSYEADHAFANPSNAMGTYNQEAAADADTNTIEFFKARLK